MNGKIAITFRAGVKRSPDSPQIGIAIVETYEGSLCYVETTVRLLRVIKGSGRLLLRMGGATLLQLEIRYGTILPELSEGDYQRYIDLPSSAF